MALAASAGGVEALTAVIGTLPGDFGAVVLAVLHVAPTSPSILPSIIARHGELPARHPTDGERLRAATVYVAPPDHHLTVAGGRARVERGPRENGVRPAADPLFRSVAAAYGPRGAGVVLSGSLDDGAHGLAEIGRVGGLTVVQDPAEAAFPSMPLAAIAAARPDHVAPAGAIGTLLVDFVAGLAGDPPADPGDPEAGDPPAQVVSGLTCPDCGGTLWVEDQGGLRFRCRVGHALSPESLLVGKGEALEKALWAAIVALEERADLYRRLLRRTEEGRAARQVRRYEEQIRESEVRARMLRELADDLTAPVGGSSTEDGEEHHGDAQ